MSRAQVTVPGTDYGQVAIVRESAGELRTLFEEVEEYFEYGASVAPGAVVVDVGANIGAFAIAVARRCQRKVRVLCFEPVPALFGALSRNLRDSDWLASGSHHAFNVALSTPDEAGTPCKFYYFRRFPRDSTMDLEHKREEFEAFFAAQGERAGRAVSWLGPGARLLAGVIGSLPKGPIGRLMSDQVTGLERLEVARETLSGALARLDVGRVDLLKVDVEGAETKVLAGVDAGTWRTIRQVAIETDGSEEHTRDLVTLVESQGLSQVRVSSPRSTLDRGLRNVIIHAARPDPPSP